MGDQIIEIGKDLSRVTIGRQPHNNLVVNDIRVSRTHARIEYRRGKFILIDQSTNGTYTEGQEGDHIHLRRDEVPLSGSGVISLGRKIMRDSVDDRSLIHFEVKA
jgi:pSer/pThr/pTyr-binding forkhead associated (FHA) protein